MGFFDKMFGKGDKDKAQIQRLKKAGADLSLPHKLEFTLAFPTTVAATKATSQLEALGLEVGDVANRGDRFTLMAAKQMVPAMGEVKAFGEKLDRVAKLSGGAYEGWRSAIG